MLKRFIILIALFNFIALNAQFFDRSINQTTNPFGTNSNESVNPFAQNEKIGPVDAEALTPGGPGGDPDASIPLDNGIVFLVFAGIFLVAYKARASLKSRTQ